MALILYQGLWYWMRYWWKKEVSFFHSCSQKKGPVNDYMNAKIINCIFCGA